MPINETNEWTNLILGDLRLVKHMIEDGIDVNNHGYKNNATALHVAAQFGELE